jgi:hypothetical protein
LPTTVSCTRCEQVFEPVGAAVKKVARTVKAGDRALSLVCPSCKSISMVLVGDTQAEPSLRCPVPACPGFVSFIEKSKKSGAFWGCGECGSIWRDEKNLQREITAIVKRFAYRTQSYKQAGGVWVPGRDSPSLTAKIGREPREADREYERG